MTGPYFETWSHENLAKFAKDAYVRLQEQEKGPLTDEEIGLLTTGDGWSHCDTHALALFARAIERKHGIGGEHD